jgi:hypothetical protein
MQRRGPGHEIPDSAGAGVTASGSATQFVPPSLVASITATGAAGADGAEVGVEAGVVVAVVVALTGAGEPTAQQWVASPQETASS